MALLNVAETIILSDKFNRLSESLEIKESIVGGEPTSNISLVASSKLDNSDPA